MNYVSITEGMVVSRQGIQVLTDNINDVDTSGILLIPGGQGTRILVHEDVYINKLAEVVLHSEYCLTVCTGSALLAKTGVLNNRKATSNKRAFEWVKSVNTNVLWIGRARWVVDQKYYTSSGVSSGIDMALGFVADRFGKKKAKEIAESIEYIWNTDSNNDQFAK